MSRGDHVLELTFEPSGNAVKAMMMDKEGDLSNASSLSSISAVSSIHQPHPPDGPRPARQPFQAHKKKVVRSPYLATSTPHPHKQKKLRAPDVSPSLLLANGLLPAKHNVRSKWIKAVRKTGHSPDGWQSAHPSSLLHTLTTDFSRVTSDTVAKQKKKNPHSSSVTSSHSAEAGDLRDLRDQLLSLKRDLVRVERERDGALVRVKVVECEVVKKEEQIQELLASGHVMARDTTRSLAQTKPATGPSPAHSTADSAPSSVSSLRLKILHLEQTVREKERELKRLREDVRVTRVREVEVESEAYYRELCRLQVLVNSSSVNSQAVRDAEQKVRAAEEARTRLSAEVRELTEKCGRLSSELERALETNPPEPITHNEQGLRGSIADRYVDHKRSELLSAIVDLELRCQEKQRTIGSLCKEMEQKQSLHDTRVGELLGNHSDAMARVAELEEKLATLTASRDKTRRVLKRLKDDRTHYRQLAEQTQAELAKLKVEREQHEKESVATEHAQKLAKRKSTVLSPGPKAHQSAASVIQQRWRRIQAEKKQKKFQDRRDKAALALQSMFRAHLAHKRFLQSPSLTSPPSHPHQSGRDQEEDEESDRSSSSVAIETIQSVLKGHLARQTLLQDTSP